MLTTKEGTQNYITAGAAKANMPLLKMFILAFMAGLFISVAGLGSAAAAVSVGAPSEAKLIVALIFPAGLAMVVINGTELFTGNNLMIMSVLDKKIKFSGMIKNWIVVYIGNFVGSIFFTAICTLGHVYSLFDNALAKNVINTAVLKSNLSFSDAFLKAIFCNVLVCVAVMMTMQTTKLSGKIVALYLPIMVFVICGFEHSVANMSYISSGIFVNMSYGSLGLDVSGLTWYNFLIGNLVPVTLGNILGGCAIGVMYWFTGKDNVSKT